jgi:hypothetical protein
MGTRHDEASQDWMLPGLLVLGLVGVVALVIAAALPGAARQVVLVLGLTGVIVSVVGVLTMLARAAHDRGKDYVRRESWSRSR